MGHVNVPEGLKEIIQQNNEKAYLQIIMEQASYPYLFHLSDIRENLIAFLPVTKQMHVLERNAGCGALTGKLLSMALHVTAVVESEEEADILRVRYENAGNLTVLVVPASDTKPETNVLYQDQAYDMILIAGEFSKFQNELSCMREHLSDNGKLYVADANRLGLKYFAGCQEEYRGGYFAGLENYDKDPERFTEDDRHGEARVYTRKEYEQILKEAGFSGIYSYYPYPDHKFPSCIYSDEYLPGRGELSDNRRNFDRDRLQLFDEKKVFDTVLAEGLFGELANSFLIEAGNRTGEQRVIYSKYSNERQGSLPSARISARKRMEKKVSENMHFIRKEESISVIWRSHTKNCHRAMRTVMEKSDSAPVIQKMMQPYPVLIPVSHCRM